MRYVWLLAVCAVAIWQLWGRVQARPGDDARTERSTSRSTAPDQGKRSNDRRERSAFPDSAPGASDRTRAHEDAHAASAMRERARIGSWNLRRLGHGEKRLDWVAQIIDREFDIVALQEVMNQEGVKELLAHLPGWGAEVSPKSVGTDKYREWYAVLYRRAQVKVSRSFVMSDRRNALMREPFIVCMAAHSFDFCLVNVHIIFGKRARDRDAEIHALGNKLIALRKKSDERDWLLVGDFNRMPRAPGWDKLRGAGWDFTLPGRVPTSLGKKGYASPYDHILVDKQESKELSGDTRRVDIIANPCDGDVEVCRTQLSDHAPIVATFKTAKDDD